MRRSRPPPAPLGRRSRPVAGTRGAGGLGADPTLIPRALLILGLVGTVAIFDLGTVKPFDVVKITVLWVCVWLAFGVWLVEVIRGRLDVRWFHLATAATVFIAAVGISTLLSATPVVSFFGWYGRYNGLLQFVLWVVLLFLVVQIYRRRPERAGELLYALGAGSAVLVGYIGIQYLGLDPVSWARPTGEEVGFPYFGTMGNSNFAGGYLGATSPWLLYAFLRARPPWLKAAVVAWAAATLGALWLTSSRGGMVAALAGALVAAVVFRRRFPGLVVAAASLAAAVVLALAVLVVWHPGMSQPPGPLAELRVFRAQTLEVRTFWWGAALGIYAAHPVVGAGPETFAVTYPRFVSPEAAGVRDAEIADKPHNVFLERAAELGTLGAGSYLAMIGLAAFWGLRRMRAAEASGAGERPAADALGCLLALGAAYIGQAAFSIDMAPLAMIAWVALGGVAVLADPRLASASGPAPAGRRSPSWRRLVVAAVVAAVTLSVVAVGTRPWRADREAKTAQVQAAGASAATVREHYERAIALHPFEPTYRGLAGDFLLRRGTRVEDVSARRSLYRQAVQRLEEMAALQPGHHLWKSSVAEALGLLGTTGSPEHFTESDGLFIEAAELAPVDHRVPMLHAEMLNRWAQATGEPEIHCRALSTFRRALELHRREARAWAGLGTSLAYLGRMDPSIAAIERARQLDQGYPQIDRLLQEVEERRDTDVPVTRCPQARAAR